MPDTARFSLMHRGAFAALLTVILAAVPAVRAGAQVPQPVVAPAPAQPEFLPRYSFHMSAFDILHRDDAAQRFSWDTHVGGSLDLVDYVVGRASVLIDYEAVLGSELRPFDANQGNYILEASLSGRAANTEIVGAFRHVSRHLSDRPKRGAIAWNTVGGRVLHRLAPGGTTIDITVDISRVVQQSFVDYTWIGGLEVQVRRDVNPHVGVFAHASGQLYGVDTIESRRGRQRAGMAEAGVRLRGGGGVLELFLGIERRVDAYPLDRVPMHWGLAGIRLLSR
jgi:hypothetical protein